MEYEHRIKIEDNVIRVWLDDYTEIIRYKGIDIITRLPSKRVVLTPGGDRSADMRDCINKYLKPFRILVNDFREWVLLVGHNEYPFKDGMKVDRGYKVSYKSREHPLSFTSVNASTAYRRLEEKWKLEAKARKAQQEKRDKSKAKREKKHWDKFEQERRVELYTNLTPLGGQIDRYKQLSDSVVALKKIIGGGE